MSNYTTSATTSLLLPLSGVLDLSVIIPTNRPKNNERNKTAISLYITQNGIYQPIGCYVYSIPNASNEIYSTILNNSNENLVDLTKKMSAILSKRYNSPTYVNLNGSFSIEEFTPLIGDVISFIEENFNSSIENE
ncbi:proteasome chaperone 4 [[Candida] anglica]